MKYAQNLVACKGCCLTNHVYINIFRSIIEGTEKLTGMGMEHLNNVLARVGGGASEEIHPGHEGNPHILSRGE